MNEVFQMMKTALLEHLILISHYMKNCFLFLFLLIVLFSCSKKKITKSEDFDSGIELAEVTNEKLEEVSGLVESIQNPGLLWTHNDSGNAAEVFLIDKSTTIILTCKLKGVKNRDWEDIAVGPGPIPGKNYVYVADIGDNFAQHGLKYIYRFEEPTLTPGIKEIEITQIDRITFQLSDKEKDTECLILDPSTKDLYVVSKREKPVYVYQLKYPCSTTEKLTAISVLSLPLTQIVGGDFSADRNELVLKSYDEIYYWNIKDNETVINALKVKPRKLTYKQEPQGEAFAWARDGSGYYTISEKVKGEKSALTFYKRARNK